MEGFSHQHTKWWPIDLWSQLVNFEWVDIILSCMVSICLLALLIQWSIHFMRDVIWFTHWIVYHASIFIWIIYALIVIWVIAWDIKCDNKINWNINSSPLVPYRYANDGAKPLCKPILFIVNWTLKNKLQWNLNHNAFFFIHENASENIVFEMAAILLTGWQVSANSHAECRWFISAHSFWR